MMSKELQEGIDRLEDVRFWLANLRRFEKFTPLQRFKLSNAYHTVEEVYDQFGQEKILDKIESMNNEGGLSK
jgi:hypothetical protein